MSRDESKDVVTVMMPLFRKHRDMLKQIHTEAVKRDPQITGDYRVFAAMNWGAFVESMHNAIFPPVIHAPTLVMPGDKISEGERSAIGRAYAGKRTR